MFTSLDAARGAAKRLKAATDGMGRPQKLTRCQAVVAAACGFNGWQHLAKTLGTPHEPSGARDKDLALRRFNETMRPLLPATLAPAIPGLFSATFGHGTGADVPGLDALLSAAVRELPPSPGFGRGLSVFGFDGPASEDGRTRRSSVPLDMRDLSQGSVEMAIATIEETADTSMPIREMRAWLRRGGETVGFVQATLYLPRGRGGVSLAEATEIADIVSDADVWAVRNLGRSEGRDVFAKGVAMLWWWEMAPPDRGGGLGTTFLRAVAADLKRRHRGLAIVALDPDDPNGKPDFASLEGGAALLPVARRRFRSHVASLDLAGCLGPRGRLVTFDNARLGGPMETMAAIGAVAMGGTAAEGLRGEAEVMAASVRNMRDYAAHFLSGSMPQPASKPRPLQAGEFPKGWSTFSVAMGGQVDPYPRIAAPLPRELREIVLVIEPPDLAFRGLAGGPVVRSMHLTFENGATLGMGRDWFDPMGVAASTIQAMNQECPSAPEAPAWPKGDLMAVLSPNLRLMVSVGRDAAAPIPCLAVATLGPGGPLTCQAHVIGWPDAGQGAAFMRDLVAAFKRQQAAALLATYHLARSVLAEGRMKREMYSETWQGERVLRQRFHATPWADTSSLTFASIGGELSSTQPYDSCAAYESFGDRLSSTVAAFVRQAVEETLTAYPAVTMELVRTLGSRDDIPGPVEAAVFLPGVWTKWADVVGGLVDAVQDEPLAKLALLADKAWQDWDEPAG